MEKIKFSCPCHFGLESVLKFEVIKIGGQDIEVSDGKVSFYGDVTLIAKANLCLSTAERVLINLAEFEARSFEELFQGVKNIPLENFISSKDKFPVKGYSLNSQLHSVPDCQAIIKKACVERLKRVYNISWFEETGSLKQIQFSIHKDMVSVYLDTTGIGLHKRGYRRNSNDAPIKETLAAGIVDLARVRADSVVVDPFCGSGTLLIESAYKACNIAPGLKRKFVSEEWDILSSETWKNERKNCLDSIKRDAEFKAYGFDIDEFSVDLTGENSRKAGVGSRIEATNRNVSDFVPVENSITMCNPPYGERMLEIKEAEKLYTIMGQVFAPSASNPCYIISPHEEFESFFGKKADKRRKLYNGMIKCQLFMYFK